MKKLMMLLLSLMLVMGLSISTFALESAEIDDAAYNADGESVDVDPDSDDISTTESYNEDGEDDDDDVVVADDQFSPKTGESAMPMAVAMAALAAAGTAAYATKKVRE